MINNLGRLIYDNIEKTKLVIIYYIEDCPIYLNTCQDKHYLIREFSILFLFWYIKYWGKY